jgi:hypothetical protein
MRFKFHLMLCTTVAIAPATLEQAAGTETCRLDISGKASGPSADICRQVGNRWTTLLGIQPVRGSIRLVDRHGYRGVQGDDAWMLESPIPNRTLDDSAYRTQDGLLKYLAESVIPHEAGHLAFTVHVGTRVVTPSVNQYSTHLPDWLDEAVAVWMEFPRIRSSRTKSVVGSTPSLLKLVTLEHPNAELVNSSDREFRMVDRMVTPPCAKCAFLPESLRTKFQIVDTGTDDSGRPKRVVWYSDRSPTKADTFEEREFYPLSYLLLRFIHARGGTAAVRELIARYKTNPKPRVEVLSSLPGLPASVTALEKAWHAFLAAPPPERD